MIDHSRRSAVDVEQKTGIFAANLVEHADQGFAERKIKDPRHDQDRSGQWYAGGIIDIRQALCQLANGPDVRARLAPRDVCNCAQHGIEHEQARAVGGAERTADCPVRIRDEGDGFAGSLGESFQNAARRLNDAAENDVVLVKMHVAKKLFEFLVRRVTVGTVQKGENDPASGGDLKVEGSIAERRRSKPGTGSPNGS
jgi:hypothetical protein